MRSEWPTTQLGDVCSKIGSGATPRGGKSVYLDAGEAALIRSQNVLNNDFSWNGLAYITTEHADQLRNVEVRAGDVLLNITGDSVARVCSAPEDVLPARVNQHVAIIRPEPSMLNALYLRYVLVSPTYQDLLLTLAATGATRNALTKGMIETLEVPFPPIAIQNSIAASLAAIDDKIANNRALAADLEAMARAIFKSWFVDFDPVKAKMEGRTPSGMDADTAALFPDALVESELGLIPEGWEVVPLQSKARLDTTSVKPFEHPATVWSHYSIPAFDDGGYPANDLGAEIKSGKHLINPAAVLVSKLNPSQWRCWRPDPSVVGEHSVCSPEFMQIVGKGVARNWIWGLCHSQPFKDLVNSTTDGTTGSRQRAKPKLVMQQPVVFPASGVVEAYEEVVKPMLARSDVLIHEIQELVELRDTLLPRLISGKLRLPEAEANIAEATT